MYFGETKKLNSNKKWQQYRTKNENKWDRKQKLTFTEVVIEISYQNLLNLI